jgi:hypothetical protein
MMPLHECVALLDQQDISQAMAYVIGVIAGGSGVCLAQLLWRRLWT